MDVATDAQYDQIIIKCHGLWGQMIWVWPTNTTATTHHDYSDNAWFGSMISSGQLSASLGAPGGEHGDFYSPLQHQDDDEDDDGVNDGLEQIVFV